eukprot:2691361-Amphidinium_carterae.1
MSDVRFGVGHQCCGLLRCDMLDPLFLVLSISRGMLLASWWRQRHPALHALPTKVSDLPVG